MKIAAIVPAAGIGKRLKSKSFKAFVRLKGKPLLAQTLLNLKKAARFNEIIVAAHSSKLKQTRFLLDQYGLQKVKIVSGGASRAESVFKALLAVSPEADWVLVHDAARPFVEPCLIARLLKAAQKTGAALCALRATATVKRVDLKNQTVTRTENRDTLYLAQTPQVFKKKLLLDRYRALGPRAFLATDEAALFDGTKTRVKVVIGDPRNIKITTPFDLELVEYYLRK